MITAPPIEISARRETPLIPLLGRLAVLIDQRPVLALPVWIFAYVAVLWRAAHRPLWFDELFTYYVATSPTWEGFIGSIRSVDLNPPLSYLLVRLSTSLFGDSPFSVRLPSILGLLAAGLIVYILITRRMGGGMGLAALGIFWSSSLTVYAVDARPYGLLLALFSLAVLCWLNAIEARHSTKWHAGLAFAVSGMFLTHCFSPVFAAAIGAGEIVRAIAFRRIDRRVWAALLAPLGILPFYIPLVRNAQAILHSPAFAATLFTIPIFYVTILAPLLPAMAAIPLFWLASGRGVRLAELARSHEIAFSIAAAVAPLVTISYCIHSGAPFWIRYGIGAILGLALILAALLAFATKRNSNATVAAAGVIVLLFCVTRGGTGRMTEEFENTSTAYRTIRPNLPFVTASGLTFLEMDHREAPPFINRLYYLTDKESALRYHSTIFEGLPLLRQWFPVRANIAPYRDFANRNRQFLMLATRGYPEDWLLPKLEKDGAQIRLLWDLKTGYRNHELYEVTLRP